MFSLTIVLTLSVEEVLFDTGEVAVRVANPYGVYFTGVKITVLAVPVIGEVILNQGGVVTSAVVAA